MVDHNCCDDSAAVLRRLQTPDHEDHATSSGDLDTQRPRDEEESSHRYALSPQAHGTAPSELYYCDTRRRLPPMRLSFSATSRSSPGTAYGSSPCASSLDSPVSPSLITPVSGRSSFDDGHTGGCSPRTGAPQFRDDDRSGCDQGPLNAAAPVARVGHQDPDHTARSWRPW